MITDPSPIFDTKKKIGRECRWHITYLTLQGNLVQINSDLLGQEAVRDRCRANLGVPPSLPPSPVRLPHTPPWSGNYWTRIHYRRPKSAPDRPSDCLPSSLTECMQGHLSATSNASRHVDHALVFNLAAASARLLLLTLAHLRQTIHAVSVDLVKL